MKIKDFIQSSIYSKLITSLAILLIILIIFVVGMGIGHYRANFACRIDDNYRLGPNNSRSIFAPFMHNADERNPHGSIGEIVLVNLPNIMIKDHNLAEQAIVISPNTDIRNLRSVATTSDLKVGTQVVVFGEPDQDGRIVASFIRIMPTSPSIASSTQVRQFQRGR
ncbi:MAG: hypothetical protein WCW03_01940 [Candidatus Paceibacterota bacterium]